LQWGQVTMPVPRQWLQWATKKESWMCLSWDVTMVNAVSCVCVCVCGGGRVGCELGEGKRGENEGEVIINCILEFYILLRLYAVHCAESLPN
jgi:hypothetical protein